MMAKVRIGAVIAALGIICGLVFLIVHPAADPLPLRPLPLVMLAWALFLGAAWLLRGIPLRWAVALIVIGGIAVQVVAVSGAPQGSDDLYRYMWDGRVQAAGYDPYAYVPAAPQLAHIRDPFLFNHQAPHCVGAGVPEPGYPGLTMAPGCTRINRPTVPTIYPPVAEFYFLVLHRATPVWAGSTPVQAAAGACAVLVGLLLLIGLWSLGRDPRWAALWAWCPTVTLEAGNNAHVDVVAVLLTLAALLVLARCSGRRRGALLGGTLLGLAIATKMTPVLVAPAVLKRRWVSVVAATAGAVALVYLPHVLAVGSKVIGFLPGYLQQEGYDSGQRFALIGLVVTGKPATLIAVLILAATGLAVIRYSDPDRPWHAAVVMTGVALAVTTPAYQWYAILLVMLVVLDGRPEWLALAAGSYLAANPWLGRWRMVPHSEAVGYGVAVVFIALVSFLRWRYPELAVRLGARGPAQATRATAVNPVAAGSGAISQSNVTLLTAKVVPGKAGEAVPEVAHETAGESVTAR
ncbi:MAG TPA: glycosyltransferase 87 family protein [Streptosporangiaceae bacterium]|nr:glycosyltransferase 87 family protein [Streptosporangiaceae bacterium]